jgi:SEC-C motif domain protein
MPLPRDCPCTSGRLYRDCCGPFHRGEREAPDAEALMRSRFAAFALKDAAYLVRTLHPDHEDRQRPEAELLRAIKDAAGSCRYMGLDILDKRPPDEDGIAEVLFLARVFQKGRDLSFVERSAFARDGEGIRYLRGEILPAARLLSDPRALTLATFPQRRSAG